MIYTVLHRTQMRYAAPVSDARFNLRLTPQDWPGQRITHASLTISPKASRIVQSSGPYLVNTTRAEFDTEIEELEILSSFTVEVQRAAPAQEGPALAGLREEALASRDISATAPAPYLFSSRIAQMDPTIGSWGENEAATDVLELALALSARLHGEFTYKPGSTSSTTPPLEAFRERHGVCQDFAHILIMALRWRGIPAAYASGYIRTQPPPGKEKLVGSDAMHAWVNVWCGKSLGWIGIDPTNNCLASDDHVQIAMGRDYADVAPIDGTFIGAAPQDMRSAVDVLETAES